LLCEFAAATETSTGRGFIKSKGIYSAQTFQKIAQADQPAAQILAASVIVRQPNSEVTLTG
jgi:hypothetical protein